MGISSYVHMIIVVEIEGEDEHSKVLVFLNVHHKYYLQGGLLAQCLQIVLIPNLIILWIFLYAMAIGQFASISHKEC